MRDGTGFVKDNGIDGRHSLDYIRVFQVQMMLAEGAQCTAIGEWRRECQGTGTCNDEYGSYDEPCLCRVGHIPVDACRYCNEKYNPGESPGYTVYDFLITTFFFFPERLVVPKAGQLTL